MFALRKLWLPLLLLVSLGVLSVIAGCLPRPDPSGDPAEPETAAPVPKTAAPMTEPETEAGPFPANELGRVMVLVYHQIGDREGDWIRSRDNFRRDLETLYQEGYRLVSLNDFLAGTIVLPTGYSPVVLTFDDSSRNQFNLLTREDRLVVDPESAVGILRRFYEEHPDFGLEATFYVNFPAPFGQPEHAADKLRRLVAMGMDLGNHTWNHTNLGRATPEEARRAIALAAREVSRAVPGYTLTSLALPFGVLPDDDYLVEAGSHGETSYQHQAVLLVGAQPAPSPFSNQFRPLRLPRVQASQTELDKWLGHFRTHPEDRYVSDGDPQAITIPDGRSGDLAPSVPREKVRVLTAPAPPQ